MIVREKERTVVVLCSVLVVVTAALYWPMTSHEFVNFDDHQYILENPHVIGGLSWSGIVWAFQCGYAANWHPLTWISHMLDCDIYGLNAGGHHLTNLLLHGVNSILLFLLLRRMTGTVWRSFFVAALFAWHPVHVESVAWASERKDVLSGLFWILTMIAYVWYCGKPSRSKFFLSLFLFALGLMSKPMLVTLPFVLLLIDFWPLERLKTTKPVGSLEHHTEQASRAAESAGRSFKQVAVGLVVEKIPFLLLTLAACGLTYHAQNSAGAVRSWVELPLGIRCANSAMSYWRYIGKAFWPVNLALIYPYHKHWPVLLVITAVLLLVILTVFFGFRARRSPYLIVGWLWFLGTLVPTLGLVQVGSQAMADRYMYIPGIGLFIFIVWGANDIASLWPGGRKWLLTGSGIAVLTGCLIVSTIQLRYWQNSEKLFTHVIKVTSNNYVAYECLGKIMGEQGKTDAALELFQEAVKIEPADPLAQYNLGTTLIHMNKLDEAIDCFAMAIKDDPRMAEAHNNWGKALLDQGKLEEATHHFAEASRLQPDNPEICYNLGTLLLRQSTNTETILRFADALRLKPEYTDALGNLKIAVMNLGGPDQAKASILEAVKPKPDEPLLYFALGLILLEQSRTEEAETQFARAIRLKPNDAGYHYYLATALIQQHKSKEAIFHFEEALRLQPDNGDALNSLAWILASDPRPELRADKEAVRLAERACQLTRNKQAAFVITLAATYANAGRFSEAIVSAQKARELAMANGDDEAVARAETLQKLFKSRHTVADALNSSPSQN